jgi:small subunit ribosomal protein S2
LNYVFQSKGDFKLPDLLIILNPKENYTALLEAQKINIPTIIFIDSDFKLNSNQLSYVIPINDDNLKAISFCCNLFIKSMPTNNY